MPIKELQTAAVRFVHVIEPNEKDLESLQERFRFHPHDLEAMIGVPQRSSTHQYQGFLLTTLLWPQWNASRQQFEVTPLRWGLSQDTLIIFDDGHLPVLREFIDDFFRQQHVDWHQDPSSAVLYELNLRLIKHAFQEYLVINTHPLAHQQRAQLAAAWSQVLVTLDQFVQQAQKQQFTGNPELVQDYHFLQSLGKQVARRIMEATSPAAVSPDQLLPKTITGYAVASTMLLIVVYLVSR